MNPTCILYHFSIDKKYCGFFLKGIRYVMEEKAFFVKSFTEKQS